MAYNVYAKPKKIKSLPVEQIQEWEALGSKIQELAVSGASAKEVGGLIASDQEFSQRVVQLAGCKPGPVPEPDLVVRAVVLLGLQRVSEVARSQNIWRRMEA